MIPPLALPPRTHSHSFSLFFELDIFKKWRNCPFPSSPLLFYIGRLRLEDTPPSTSLKRLISLFVFSVNGSSPAGLNFAVPFARLPRILSTIPGPSALRKSRPFFSRLWRSRSLYPSMTFDHYTSQLYVNVLFHCPSALPTQWVTRLHVTRVDLLLCFGLSFNSAVPAPRSASCLFPPGHLFFGAPYFPIFSSGRVRQRVTPLRKETAYRRISNHYSNFFFSPRPHGFSPNPLLRFADDRTPHARYPLNPSPPPQRRFFCSFLKQVPPFLHPFLFPADLPNGKPGQHHFLLFLSCVLR